MNAAALALGCLLLAATPAHAQQIDRYTETVDIASSGDAVVTIDLDVPAEADFVLEGYLDVLNASLQSEVVGFYLASTPGEDGRVEVKEQPIALPLVYPMLGVKGTW